MSLLVVRNVNTYRGASHILVNVSLKVNQGEAVFLLGRNGAGKTTTIESIMGVVPPFTGSILFKGIELVEEERNPFKCTSIVSDICQLGIGLVPENRRIFANLTVRENLLVAESKRKGSEKQSGPVWNEDSVYDLFPALKEMRNKMAHHMSGGEKQMLTIGRALMGNPELLLLDEPSEGLAPAVKQQLKEKLIALKEMGISMVIAEQNLSFVRDLGERVYILENGAIKFSGPVVEFLEDPSIRLQFLGI